MSPRARIAPLIVGLIAAPLLAETIELKPRYTAGHQARLALASELTQKITAEGQPEITILYRDEVGFTRKVEEASADGARLALEFDRRAMSFNHPMMGNQRFDSDAGDKAEDNNSMSLIAAPWLGRKLELVLGADNSIKEIKGYKELMEAVDNSALGDMLYENLRAGMTEDNMGRSLHGGLFDYYPEKPVAVGDTWTRTVANPAQTLGTIEVTYNAKLDKIEERDGRKVAVITYTTSSKLTSAGQSPMGTPELVDSKGQGTAVVDIETGLPIEQSNEGARILKFTQPGQDGAAGQQMTLDGQTKSSLRVLSDEQRAAQKEENRKAAAAAAATAASKEPS
jgi:hypothetical protein